ncbi:MAG: hypothetical protein IJL07_04400 [Lachnospiraceae bacterium]|nr:hypothetical protein [Lachnospiraceae bacterium]
MSNVPINQQALDQKKKTFSPDLSLDGEIQSAPQWMEQDRQQAELHRQQEKQYQDEMHAIEQDRIQKHLESLKLINTPKLYYAEMAERIEKKSYDRSVFIKWKRRQSSQMKNVTGSLKRLTALLDSSVDQGDFETIKSEYLTLVQACDTYMDNHAPSTDEGMARYAMIEQIKSHVMAEMKDIDGNSKSISQEDRAEGKKWRDVLIGVPVVTVAQDKIHKSDEQGQTSEIRRVEVKGKRFIFKKMEKVQTKGFGGGDHDPWFIGSFTETCQEFMKELVGLEDRSNPMYKDMPEEARVARITELRATLEAAKKAQYVFPIIAGSEEIEELNKRIRDYRNPEGFYKDRDPKEKEEAVQELQKKIDKLTAALKAYPDVFDDELKNLLSIAAYTKTGKIVRYVFPDIQELETEETTASGEGEDVPPEIEEKREKLRNKITVFARQLQPVLDSVEKKRVVVDAGMGRAKIQNGKDLSVRNVATTVMADTLKVSSLIAESRLAEIEVEGKREKGLLMSEAKGITGLKMGQMYAGKTAHLSAGAIKQLMSLQVFDYICGQVDRHYNNFLMDVEEKDGKVMINGITAIDHDLSFGKLTSRQIELEHPNEWTQTFIRPLQLGETPQLMALDKPFADRIIALEPTQVIYLLKPFLQDNEISATLDRLKTVQQFLQNEVSKYEKGEESVLIGEKEQDKWEALRAKLDKPNPVEPDPTLSREERWEADRKKRDADDELKSRSYIQPFMVGWDRLR